MNVDVRPNTMRTAAELALADAYAAARPTLPGGGVVAAAREAAFRRFEAQGLPGRRREDWKYTDLRVLMREALPLAAAPDAAVLAAAKNAGGLPADFEARRLTFADGAFVPELSDLSGIEDGLSIRTMSDALNDGDAEVLAGLGQPGGAPQDPMASPDTVGLYAADPVVALNAALSRDGVVVRVAAGATVQRPLHLVFAAGERPASVFARSLLVVEKGARVMVVESHAGGAGHQINTAFEMRIADDAHVDYVKLSGSGAGVLHVSSLLAIVGAHARFNAFAFNTGGAVVRNQLFLRFDGEGTVAGLGGASLLSGRQHVDNTLVVEHVARGCQSREVFKAVLDDESRNVFQGRIVVRSKAQKTDARMMTRALLLSDEAEADHKPELEIFADDVQCGHGATSGALDENLKFYLMARGIPKAEAEALLVQSFVGEAVETIEHAGLREALMDSVLAWLRARGG